MRVEIVRVAGRAWRKGRVRTFAAGAVGLVVVGGLLSIGADDGYDADKARLQSGSAWLASSQVGQLTLLDGSSAEVASQVQVASPGSRLDVVQQGSTGYAIDRTTGSMRRVDGATFDLSAPATPIPDAGESLRAFAGADALYALDTRRGVLTGADPRTLANQGRLLPLAAQVTPDAVTLDAAGRMWVLDATTGDLVWLQNGQRHVRRSATQPGAGMLTLAGGNPVLVDTARRTAAVLDPESAETRDVVGLDLRPGDKIQLSGSPHASRLYVVASRGVLAICDLTRTTCDSAVPLTADGDLGAAVETGGRVFVPDYTTGRVWIVDLNQSRIVAKPQVLPAKTRFQLLTRDGIVFFNDPDSEHAGVIQFDGGVRPVAKYDPKDPGKGVTNPDGSTGLGSTTASPGDQSPPPGSQPPTSTPPTPERPDTPKIRITVSTKNPYVGESVTLKVTADGGRDISRARWTFGDGQSDDGITVTHQWSSGQTFQITVRATVEGVQVVASYSLTVLGKPLLTVQSPTGGTVTGGGISCPQTCSVAADPGASITLTAQPAANFEFVGWGGACAGTGACTVTMDKSKTVNAGFRNKAAEVSVEVSAVKGTYSGACPPPGNATTYSATISVTNGPVTVSFRWTSSNGGDTDPSTKTVTFTGTGPQSRTVTHNEAFYLPGETVNDWIAVNLLSPVQGQSNHVPYRLTCVQPPTVSATVSAVKGSYTGACPPPADATTYRATISVTSGPVTVTYRWTTSNGGDSDPSTKTINFTGTGAQSRTVTHNEAFYLPGETITDWVAVELLTPQRKQSNRANFSLTCT
jgi:hypothetical protein